MRRNDFKSTCEICGICCTFWFLISLIVCNLIYFIWSIFIVSNSNLDCPSSYINPYMISSIVFTLPRYLVFKGFHWIANELENTFCKGIAIILIITIIEISLACFGGWLLFQNKNDCFDNNNILENINVFPIIKLSFASFIIQVIISLKLIIVLSYIFCKNINQSKIVYQN